MSKHKWGCIIRKCDDGLWLVADATTTHWLSSDGAWNTDSPHDFYECGTQPTKGDAMDLLARATTPPPTYTAPHVEVKPDPWPSMMAKVTDAMNRLCDAAEQMKKERDEAIAERDAVRAELERMKEERK